jgi:hypothetical protein
MNDVPAQGTRRRPWALVLTLVGLGAAGAAAYLYANRNAHRPPPATTHKSGGDLVAQIDKFCGACHLVPAADVFPRSQWKDTVERMYVFFGRAGKALQPPPIEEVVKFYEERAPEKLPLVTITQADTPPPLRLAQIHFGMPPEVAPPPAISNVNVGFLSDAKRPDVLVCDMRNGLVMVLKPQDPAPALKVLTREIPNPAHTEVVDLDGDGIKDILVANLGNFLPTDRRCGSVEWLRGTKDGRFVRHTLLADVGRVADVQAADFRGVGKLDLVVAAFGWNNVGEIIYLENKTTDWDHPKFEPHVLDERQGTIHVPVTRLQGQGKDRPPDFIAVISQQHETVVAFLNEGNGKFRKETIYTAPHPAWGSSGIQVVDLNGDGEPDVLYTNGDTLDAPYLLKPYHGIQWLENPGRGRFPWKYHKITPLYGVHRAVAADFRGLGKRDIMAVSFLPGDSFAMRNELGLDALIFLGETGPGRWARHSLEKRTCDHATCVAGDLYGTGRIDLVTGSFVSRTTDRAVTIWKNLGPPK